MLTERQRDCLEVVCQHYDEQKTGPTFAEIGKALDLRSKQSVGRLLDGLEERGFIRRHLGKARAIEPLRLPDGRPYTPTNVPSTAADDLAMAAAEIVFKGGASEERVQALSKALTTYMALSERAA